MQDKNEEYEPINFKEAQAETPIDKLDGRIDGLLINLSDSIWSKRGELADKIYNAEFSSLINLQVTIDLMEHQAHTFRRVKSMISLIKENAR